MTARRSERLLPILILVVTLGLTGCGIGPTDWPVDQGDAAAGEAGSDNRVPRTAPGPDEARSADDQVRNFLLAAVGGLSAATENVKSYLTSNALRRWVDPLPPENPPLSVVRIVGGPTVGASVNGRTRVTLDYQLIGTMTDQGRVDDLVVPVVTRQLTFWIVVEDPSRPSNLRIDEIVDWPPGALLISDEGLQNYYRIQPIYFWDMDYKRLVPDLRYVPLTKNQSQKAHDILTWLVTGPSNWLGAVQRLPAGMSVQDVVASPDQKSLTVSLSGATAGTGDPDAQKRLMYQIQWSLTSLFENDAAPRIELSLDNQPASDVNENEFRQYNRSWAFNDQASAGYDIRDRAVVPAGGASPTPLLGLPENSNVIWAAIRSDDVGAFVRELSPGRRSLQIVAPGVAARATDVPTNATMGRPSFVPDTDIVLLPTGGSSGRLLAVSTTDGTYAELSHSFTGVTSVAVSPDGRRVAVVADGEVFVYSLRVQNNEVTLTSSQRQLLAGRLETKTVTWTSEAWLLVAGTSGPTQALWRVSSDGVLAEDLSGQLGGLSVEDLVCYPSWTGSPLWANRERVGALATTTSGVYSFRTRFDQVDRVKPFFAS